MRTFTRLLAAASATACLFALPVAHAEGTMDAEKFTKMCDMDKDGMVSKKEMLSMMEKMFDKHDTKKAGKLDKQQVDAFLKELVKSGS